MHQEKKIEDVIASLNSGENAISLYTAMGMLQALIVAYDSKREAHALENDSEGGEKEPGQPLAFSSFAGRCLSLQYKDPSFKGYFEAYKREVLNRLVEEGCVSEEKTKPVKGRPTEKYSPTALGRELFEHLEAMEYGQLTAVNLQKPKPQKLAFDAVEMKAVLGTVLSKYLPDQHRAVTDEILNEFTQKDRSVT